MMNKFRELSPLVKVLLILGILLGSYLVWWLASPLFLSGPFANDTLDEDATVIKTGEMIRFDSSHWGEGTVNIIKTESGDLKVQFVDVEIANGPDLVVYVTQKSNFSSTTDEPGLNVNLGDLPATAGNFEMDIPSSLSFEIGAVMIWCDPFEIVFTYATMTAV